MTANITPFTILRAKIAAEMAANGTTHADAAAFNSWLYSSWIDSGFTGDFACLYQSDASATFSVGVRVAASGHKVNVWWGDGTTNSYTPSTSSNTTVSKTYGTLAKRPIVVLGRITAWEGVLQAYGGRLWSNLRSLTALVCGGCTLIGGSISEAPAGLTYLVCWSCPLIDGSISEAPSGLTTLDCGNCPLIGGSISAAPAGLTYLVCWGCPLIDGSISEAPAGLIYLSCGGCSLIGGLISEAPAGLTALDCAGCSLIGGSISEAPSGLTTLACGGCPITYDTPGRVWAPNFEYLSVNPSETGIFTSAMTDACIIDLSSTTFAGAKTINLAGNCGAPTSAADDASDTLLALGVTVNIN